MISRRYEVLITSHIFYHSDVSRIFSSNTSRIPRNAVPLIIALSRCLSVRNSGTSLRNQFFRTASCDSLLLSKPAIIWRYCAACCSRAVLRSGRTSFYLQNVVHSLKTTAQSQRPFSACLNLPQYGETAVERPTHSKSGPLSPGRQLRGSVPGIEG